MKVANRKVIFRIALKSFIANRIRNIFAVVAIILTSILYTSLFTGAVGLNYTMEQQMMRQVGGSSHGTFKNLTKDQVEQLSSHPLIQSFGTSRMLSVIYEGNFAKHSAEIRYMDKEGAKMFFSYPATGRLPKDKMELATDTTVLKLLGVKAEIGEKITISYGLNNRIVTDTFTLCGFWKGSDTFSTSQIILSQSYVEEKLTDYQPVFEGDWIGSWRLEIMFKNSGHIEENLRKIAEDNGYQIDDPKEEHYLDIGVNWAYTSAQMENNNTIVLAVAAIALLILITGYLLIYNIFQISVSNDIRYYGLLKTIGTTGRQMKRILRIQAMLLSILGIPFGLLLGYVIGVQAVPIIFASMSDTTTYQKADPVIFIGAAVFTLLTVFISIRKPGRLASRVSPLEAIRYTEGNQNKRQKSSKKSTRGARIYRMAITNLSRNKKKTVIVILSLSISIVLLNCVYAFTKGFDADKYIGRSILSDFTLGSANTFTVQKLFRTPEDVVSEEFIKAMDEQQGILHTGRIYFDLKNSLVNFTDEMVDKTFYGTAKEELPYEDIDGDGLINADIQLYGMDDFPLEKMQVVEGKIDLDKFKSGNYILYAIDTDDYGNPYEDQRFYHPQDQVTIDYADEYDYSEEGKLIVTKYHSRTYEVMAVIKNEANWNVRYYSSIVMVLPAAGFIEDTGTDTTMTYIVDTEPEAEASIESFVKDYTASTEPDMSYASKQTYEEDMSKFRNIFLIIGGVLSIIVGLVGILNFANVNLTGIMIRKREFSVMKSIGMTGRQLKKMLLLEGVCYTMITVVIAAGLSSLIQMTVLRSWAEGLWFFTSRFTLLPVIVLTPILFLLGLFIPVISYQMTDRQSIVEQLRNIE